MTCVSSFWRYANAMFEVPNLGLPVNRMSRVDATKIRPW